jgi:hypothetical protein
MEKKKEYTVRVPALNWLFSLITAMIGHTIHNSIFWSIMDFLFWPIAWIKWIIYQEVNISLIKETFAFFFK